MSHDGFPKRSFRDLAVDLRSMAMTEAISLEASEILAARTGTPQIAQDLRDFKRRAETLGKLAVLLERLAPLEFETRSALAELLEQRERLP